MAEPLPAPGCEVLPAQEVATEEIRKMRRARCPEDSELKLGPRGGKALYDPQWDHGNNTGRDTTFRRLKRYLPNGPRK
jgi:hypothetical protein